MFRSYLANLTNYNEQRDNRMTSMYTHQPKKVIIRKVFLPGLRQELGALHLHHPTAAVDHGDFRCRDLNVDGRANRAKADVAVSNSGLRVTRVSCFCSSTSRICSLGSIKTYIGQLALDVLGDTGILGAVASVATGLSGLLGGVARVEPEHVGVVLYGCEGFVNNLKHCFFERVGRVPLSL